MPAETATDDNLREWELPDRLADYVTENFFPVAARTVAELWPTRFIVVNKRRLMNTADTLAHADNLMERAVKRAVRGGRAPAAGTDDDGGPGPARQRQAKVKAKVSTEENAAA